MAAARRAVSVGPWPRRAIADRARLLREARFFQAADALSRRGGSAVRDGDRLDYEIRVPLGVVALHGLEQVGPALAAGNAVVVATGEATDLAADLDRTDLPAGVFNLVYGADLAGQPGVDLVRVPATGPTPVILFEDGDPAAAIAFGTRLIVQRALYDRVCEIAPVRARNMTERVPATQEIPESAREHVLSGGIAGGELKPTVIDGVDVELAGPVITILPFDDEDEAVALARAGERASVWTSDLARAHRFAHALRAEHCWLNAHVEPVQDGPDRYSRLAAVHL